MVNIDTKFMKFVLVGAINTFFTWMMFVILVELFDQHYNVGVFVSWVMGMAITYWLNLVFVFTNSMVTKPNSFMKFFVVAIGYLISNMILIKIAVDMLHFNASLSQAAIIVILFICRYIVTSQWVFRDGKTG